MQKKAFIHIGLAKTGTTSIQHRLASNRAELKQKQYCYPYVGVPEGSFGQHGLAWHLLSSRKLAQFCPHFRIDAFRREVQGAASKDLLVSSEELSSLSFSYPNVRSLLRLFPEHDVHVVAYVREQAAFFNSFYLEILSDFVDPGSFEDFVQARLLEKRYDYRHWFGIWDDLVGQRLLIRPFDKAILKDGDVVEDFKATVGLRAKLAAGEGAKQNVALNSYQAAAMLHLIEEAKSRVDAADAPAAAKRKLKRAAAKIMLMPELANGEPFWAFGPELLNRVKKHYDIANAEFFRAHGLPDFVFESATAQPVTVIGFGDLDETTRKRVDQMWREMTAA